MLAPASQGDALMSDDTSSIVNNWSDRKLFAELRAAIERASVEEEDSFALGHLGGARAIMALLCDRLSERAKATL
jgi:hypothetical protein